ncbi:MAG: pseudouridine synthase [Mucilaginibacter sp.]
MAFNRPGNGRDDKSGRSSNRAPKTGERPKRATSSRGNSAPGSDQQKSTRPSKKYNNEAPGEKKSFSPRGSSSYDKPASNFSSSDKKPFTGKSRPYSGRPTDGESSGEKRAFAPKGRPYTGRTADNDPRPAKSFSAGDKKPFTSRGSSTSGFNSDDKPKRSFGGERTGDKKPFSSRSKSSTGSFNADDKPKRSFSGERTGDKKFTAGPSGGLGFKRTSADKPYDADRPQRSKHSYDKITKDQDAPAKTLRGRKKGPAESKDTGLIRLNRYISNAGICSRRKADELIAAGVVSVNGIVINELGHKVDPQKDEIRYNGELLKREKMVYVLLNKPKDYITTTEDPQERRTVMHLVEKASKERIYPVGRLDRNTTGLLLMTNDGDLADKLSHPRNSITKLYQVELNKSLTQGDLNKIGFGIELEDGLIKPDSVSYVAGGSKREVGIQIHSGKNRIVRRLFEHLGYEVVKLDRAVYANLTKKDLPRGRWRFLEDKEVIQLKHLIQS